jgi:hypothetical protein
MSNDSYSKRRTECANAGASGTDEATSYRAVTTLTSARNFLGERPGPVCQTTDKAARERQTVQSEAINTVVGNPVVTLVLVHTIVPILDESGTVVDRLFIYSDKPDGR